MALIFLTLSEPQIGYFMCEMGIAVSVSCGECEKLNAMGKNMAAPSTPFSGPLAAPVIMMMMIVAISFLVELRKACSITIHHLQKHTEGVRPIIPYYKHRSMQNEDPIPATSRTH